ncbi:hypothetical protein CDD81_3643 [Ophiocordyceps australis]|uniref:Uncharacterized protein n=1 Tax=Ophiocordyceps australis TaxID=1399860 RepID=A0A2C5YBC3_9HYPO|nr:hypothetical protein CDD81_3643 [Ophiocordyceps australis]
MKPAKCLPSSWALVLTVAMALSVAAQDRTGNRQTPDQSLSSDRAPTSASESPSATAPSSQTDSSTQSTSDQTTSEATSLSSSESTTLSTSESTTLSTSESTTSSTSDSTSSTSASQEEETSTSRTTPTASATRSTGFPSLTRGGGIPEYPPPTVPPTQDAPFMHRSRMPEGTVFIAVGAVLGAFGLGILIWRSLVSFLLHRSVKRAALAQHESIDKSFPAPPAPFYKYTDQGSDVSFGPSAAVVAGRGVRRTNRGPIPSATPSHSNLFFSPTAAPNNPSGSRGSTYLPSGFYTPGNGAPPLPANQTNSINLSNLRPDSRGRYTNTSRHTIAGTPPDSPQCNARRDLSGMSTSSLNLSSPLAGQRAPSAYLEDLLADDPSSFPPPQMPRPYSMAGYTNTPQSRF